MHVEELFTADKDTLRAESGQGQEVCNLHKDTRILDRDAGLTVWYRNARVNTDVLVIT